MLSANDSFLDLVAHQAQVAYASQQLQVLQGALQGLLKHSEAELAAGVSAGLQYELAYYTQQIERWLDYLGCLGSTKE